MSEKKCRTLTLWLTLALVAVALVAVGSCGPTTGPEPTSSPEPELTAPPEPTALDTLVWKKISQSNASVEDSDGRLFVPDEVIVMGPQETIAQAFDEALDMPAPAIVYELQLDRLLPPDFFADLAEAWPQEWQEEWEDKPVIGLYATGNMTAPRAVELLNNWNSDVPLFAELNLFTGHPHSVAGSPHSVAGSPLDVHGVGAPGAFWLQWAFGAEPGIGLIARTGETTGSRQIADTGAGTQIAIFDSSPFTDEGTIPIGWITPELRLQVSHVLTQPAVPGVSSDHGLFVAGLAHAVAPSSTIHLVQVLDDNLIGNLGTLNYALGRYMIQRRAESSGGRMDNTVLNFSLGVRKAPQGGGPPHPKQELLDAWMNALNAGEILTATSPLPSFETLIILADTYGAALVAASGNGTGAQKNKSELPADYDDVIGVEASGRGGDPTCYTKNGEVAAPGGDPLPGGPNDCLKKVDPDCDLGMVSLIYRTSLTTSYACWIGTSFAAPLVSGEVALKLAECGGHIPATDLIDIVYNGASVVSGNRRIINLPNTINNRCNP